MVLADFKSVVNACQQRKFGVRAIVSHLIFSESATSFGGAGGPLQQVDKIQSDDAAIDKFCWVWSNLNNNESIINVIQAAQVSGDFDFAQFILMRVESIIRRQGGDQDSKKQLAERLMQLGLSSRTQAARTGFQILGGNRAMSYYYHRVKLASTVLDEIKAAASEPGKGPVIIKGGGGLGKTTLMVHLLATESNKQFFLETCNLQVAIWINCYQWRDDFNEHNFLAKVSEVVKPVIGSIGDQNLNLATIVNSFGDCRPIFILDDMFNVKLLEFFRTACPSAVCCVVTRETLEVESSAPSFINMGLYQSIVPVVEWEDEEIMEALKVTYRLGETKLKVDQLEELVKRCCQLPLIVSMIASHFHGAKNASETQLQFQYRQLMRKLNTKGLLVTPLKDSQYATVKILFQFSIDRLPDGELKFYYSFLLFDPAELIRVDDLAVLWSYSDLDEVFEKCYTFEKLSLLREHSNNDNKTALFSIHQLLYEAAIDFATVDEQVLQLSKNRRTKASYAADVFDLRFKVLTGVYGEISSSLSPDPNVAAIAAVVERNNRGMLETILNNLDARNLGKICLLTGSRLQGHNFLHFVYKHRWPDDQIGKINGFGWKLYSFGIVLRILLKLQHAGEEGKSLIDKIVTDSLKHQDGFLTQVFNDQQRLEHFRDHYQLRLLLEKWHQHYDNARWKAIMLEKHRGNKLYAAAITGDVTILNDFRIEEVTGEEATTAMQMATRLGHLEILKLLKSNISPEVITKLLLLAAEYGSFEVVEFLFDHDPMTASSLVTNDKGRTPLSLAAEHGHLETAKFLADKNALSISMPDELSRTPLSLAAENGHLDLVTFLSENDESASMIFDKNGHSPLSWAADNGHFEVVKFLYEKDPSAITEKDNLGNTPLWLAALHGHLEIVKFFYEKAGLDVVEMAPNHEGMTAVAAAASNGHLKTVEFLCGLDPKMVKVGEQPLYKAAEYGHLDVVQFLYDLHPSAVTAVDTNSGLSALSAAAGKGFLEVVQFLYDKHPAAILERNSSGRTPLMIAAVRGHLEVVKLLHQKNASAITKTDRHGQTALSLAALNGHLETVRFLTEKEPSIVELVDDLGQTPFSLAASKGRLAVVAFLFEKYSYALHIADNEGRLPLALAIRSRDLPTVEFVYEKNPSAIANVDKNGETALSLAKKLAASTNLMKFLRSKLEELSQQNGASEAK